MVVTRIKRLVNPTRPRKRNFSAKQIKAGFGGKRRLASLKAKRSRTAHAKPRRSMNPAHIVTLGLINPERSTGKKGKTKLAATRKQLAALRKARAARGRASNPRRRKARRTTTHRHVASNPRRRRATGRKRNSTRIYVMPKRNGRRRHATRNPDMFGMRGMAAGKAILAGLVGVYATKTVTPMVASAVPQIGSSPIISAIVSAGIAWGGGMLLSKWDKTAGEGFMFGGLMQAGSQLLNLIVPTNPISLSGLGDWVSIAPTGFPVPSNDIRRAMLARQGQIAAAPMSAAPTTLAGMGAAAMFR